MALGSGRGGASAEGLLGRPIAGYGARTGALVLESPVGIPAYPVPLLDVTLIPGGTIVSTRLGLDTTFPTNLTLVPDFDRGITSEAEPLLEVLPVLPPLFLPFP